jgi:aminotransferase
MTTSILKNSINNSYLHISKRLLHSNISIIKEMMYLAEEEKNKGKEVVSLGVGIPYYKMPEQIRNKVIESLRTIPDIDKYTFFPGLPKLRAIIAEQDSQKLGIEAKPDDILITPGSMAALLYATMALINEGDEMIILSPYFSSYAEQVILAGGKPVEVPLKKTSEKNGLYQLDLEKIGNAITSKTKGIILNSPHNPTGTVFQKDELIKLAEITRKHDIYIITDEVYEYLIYEGEYFNIASIQEIWPKVIRCCSFSKKYGMTGWRIGYLHTNKELLQLILRLHDNTIVCAPHIAQEGVYAAISMTDLPELRDNHAALRKNRQAICNRLDLLNDLFSYTPPHGAYYIFPKYSLQMDSIEFAKKLLYEAGVVTVPGIGFGEVGEQHIRLSFGGNLEEIHQAFDKIERWWDNFKKLNNTL